MVGHHLVTRRSLGLFTLVAAVIGGFALSSVGVSPAQDKNDKTLSAFMRKKLDASSRILEGLTTENDALVREGANRLLEMSRAEIWNVLVDEDYREFNRDFRGSVRKLHDAAEKGNFDNATLQWMDAVKACVECHKYVRSQRPKVKN